MSDLADALAKTDLAQTAPQDTPASKPRGGRKPRAPRAEGDAPARRGPPTGEPSKTLLFVANLPFSVDDAKLGELFAAYTVVSARVVTKKVGPSEGRSKGFGFVELGSEEEQLKALAEIQGKEVDGRELQVSKANGPGEQPAAEAAEAPAAEASA